MLDGRAARRDADAAALLKSVSSNLCHVESIREENLRINRLSGSKSEDSNNDGG